MLDIPFRSAKQLAADVRKKKIGCLELLDLYLARVEKYDGALNAVVVRDFDRARTRARAADRALARRQVWGPLHGVPMTIKESYLAVNGQRVPVTDHLFWAGYSGAFYLPSTAAPCGFTPGGLPVGVQIVGPQYGDLTCLALARLLEREFQAFVPPPGYA